MLSVDFSTGHCPGPPPLQYITLVLCIDQCATVSFQFVICIVQIEVSSELSWLCSCTLSSVRCPVCYSQCPVCYSQCTLSAFQCSVCYSVLKSVCSQTRKNWQERPSNSFPLPSSTSLIAHIPYLVVQVFGRVSRYALHWKHWSSTSLPSSTSLIDHLLSVSALIDPPNQSWRFQIRFDLKPICHIQLRIEHLSTSKQILKCVFKLYML